MYLRIRITFNLRIYMKKKNYSHKVFVNNFILVPRILLFFCEILSILLKLQTHIVSVTFVTCCPSTSAVHKSEIRIQKARSKALSLADSAAMLRRRQRDAKPKPRVQAQSQYHQSPKPKAKSKAKPPTQAPQGSPVRGASLSPVPSPDGRVGCVSTRFPEVTSPPGGVGYFGAGCV